MLSRDNLMEAGDALAGLREYIASNGLKPGQRLPSERDLTAELGLSRSKLRKALDALEREGTIWRHVGKGTFVAATAEDLESMTAFPVEIGKQLTPFKMMRARLALEPAIAREAAINATGEALSHMHLAMERAHAAETWELYEDQDDQFHRAVAEASDNLLLLTIFDQLNMVRRAVAWGSVTRQSVKPASDHTSFTEHEQIAAAISNREPAVAYEAMRVHLKSVFGRLFADN